VWLGEGRHCHTRLGPVAIQRGEQDLLKQRELREIEGRVRQGAIDHGPRLLQVEGLQDLREEVQGATRKVCQKVRWGARCVILAKSFKLIILRTNHLLKHLILTSYLSKILFFEHIIFRTYYFSIIPFSFGNATKKYETP
jgi:hypothetical protein